MIDTEVIDWLKALVRQQNPRAPFNGRVVVLDDEIHTDTVSGTTYISRAAAEMIADSYERSDEPVPYPSARKRTH